MSNNDGSLSSPFQLEGRYRLDNYKSDLTPSFLFKAYFKTSETSTLIVNTQGFDVSAVGNPKLVFSRIVKPFGVGSPNTGIPRIQLQNRRINTAGINSLGISNSAVVYNFHKQAYPAPINSAVYGKPLIYNLKQFVSTYTRNDQSSYGTVYLQGGVKYLDVRGYAATLMGKVDALNTKVTQEARPTGINSLGTGKPDVSPRILYASGFYYAGFGKPDIRTPVLFPDGVINTSYGSATVWYHTRPISPNGTQSYESGYPRVADPTQFIQAPSLLTSAIFGDTAIRNISAVINVPAIDSASFSDYSTLTNSNRYYSPTGINSLSIGAVSISNGTPELFPNGFDESSVSLPAIGHRIRSVTPTGFDRLLLGTPLLTKTPELNTRGHSSSVVATPNIWHKIRTVRAQPIDSYTSGNATAWFRYRYIAHDKSWESHKFGRHGLTHGLRELEGHGFTKEAYGLAWISQGTRRIEANSIHQDFASNHMVGGTQTVSPQGYEATQWGTRIIPESQSLFPIGAVGDWGLATVSLYEQYISPPGYISVGQQPQDRWGDVRLYNSVQHVIQNFDGGNGLVPPKWSDWQSIENRNKTIGASGFNSQKFGYSQIDNNAAPLLPKGIEPPVGEDTMIAYSIRGILLDGIDPPIVSSWGVVYNGARVLAPIGANQSKYGNEGSAINTRREYRNIGRIDSLDMGKPVIGYRIRKVEIEPRYSIEPPQINLPTIDLYTRYVSYRGYETAAYGLPSLSIHFNIIAPKWNYRDKLGTPALRNVTPELLINGHNSDEYGDTHIRTQWREVKVQGDNSNVFGQHKTSDTKQTIEVRGLLSSMSSQRHTVTQTGSNPYVVQRIWLDNESGYGKGYGISSDDEFKANRIPKPGFNQNVLYPSGIFKSSPFGSATLHSNNIVVDSGYSIEGVSKGLIVRNKNNEISVSGIPRNEENVGDPRLSPHTIYAVKEAPAQAKANHKSGQLHYIGEVIGYKPAGEIFGIATIESTIRSIRPVGFNKPNNIGKPNLYLSTQVIQPEAFRLSRFGLPSIPFTLQKIGLQSGISENNWGQGVVSRPDYVGNQYIIPVGLYAFSSNGNKVENMVRYLYASGHDSLIAGTKKNNDSPYMWQGLRVGEHVPFIVGGEDMSLFGETVISLRIRSLSLQGFNAFESNYETSSFDDRMKVFRGAQPESKTTVVAVNGINSLGISPAVIKLKQQFIRPDGNSDQFRKGGYSG